MVCVCVCNLINVRTYVQRNFENHLNHYVEFYIHISLITKATESEYSQNGNLYAYHYKVR